MERIPPRSGVAFILEKGRLLKVYDIEGEQVSDLICYNLHDRKEHLSSGRTLDYSESLYLTTGHSFYSNRSNVMFKIVEDTVGRHDFLLAPCSAEMFRIIYGHTEPHHGCFGNLQRALSSFGIEGDDIPTCFNLFMNVAVDGNTGKLSVLPPKSKAGDYVVLQAQMDLIVGMTACSAGMSNNFSYKPIGYEICENQSRKTIVRQYNTLKSKKDCMIIIHDIFICKPGNASKLAKKLKEAMSTSTEHLHIMTDITGPFNKVVAVSQYENLTAYEQSWEKFKENSEEMKQMEEAMAGYQDMYVTGSREIYQVW